MKNLVEATLIMSLLAIALMLAGSLLMAPLLAAMYWNGWGVISFPGAIGMTFSWELLLIVLYLWLGGE